MKAANAKWHHRYLVDDVAGGQIVENEARAAFAIRQHGAVREDLDHVVERRWVPAELVLLVILAAVRAMVVHIASIFGGLSWLLFQRFPAVGHLAVDLILVLTGGLDFVCSRCSM